MHDAPTVKDCALPLSSFLSCTVLRCVGWLFRISKDGVYNLPPYTQWQNLTFDPLLVMPNHVADKAMLPSGKIDTPKIRPIKGMEYYDDTRINET